MLIEVDSGGFETVCGYLYDLNHDVYDLMNTLSNTLADSGSMAGSDTCGAAWSAQYDPVAAQAFQAGCNLIDAAGHMANLTNAALVNHLAADGGAQVYPSPYGYSDDGDKNPDHYNEGLAFTPPSAAGGTGDTPSWWHWVASHLEGWFWPDADTDKLRTAGNAWTTAANSLRACTYLVDGASADYALITSPEVTTATKALTSLRTQITNLASVFDQLGKACTDYGNDVDQKHSEVDDQLKSFLEWTAGIEIAGGILGAVTLGLGEGGAQVAEGAEVANAANKVRAVLQSLLELADGVAAAVKAAVPEVVEVIGNLGRFLKGGKEAAEIEEASSADAMAAVRALGSQGERDAQIVKNTDRITAASGKARYRIPDELNDTQLGEVKNVKKQGWTSQLSDFYDYATSQDPPLKMVLYVRSNTQIVGKLAQLIADGDITLVRNLPKVTP